MTEQQPYELLRREPGFEVRRYPAHVVAQTTVSASFDDAGNRAFRYLFGYISGDNQVQRSIEMTAPVVQAREQKIAMTAPVVQREENGAYVVAFVLPASMTMATAPTPTRPEVTIREIPASLTAAVRFGGRWTRKSFESHRDDLLADVASAGLLASGDVRFARFDPPYTPAFLRHNEVLVDLLEPSSDGPTAITREPE
jgi:hypothetical protein